MLRSSKQYYLSDITEITRILNKHSLIFHIYCSAVDLRSSVIYMGDANVKRRNPCSLETEHKLCNKFVKVEDMQQLHYFTAFTSC